MGFFQVINHGISKTAIEDAFVSSAKFFDLPNDDEEKKKLTSNDIAKPVRFEGIGSSSSDNNNDSKDNDSKVSKEFIKLYAHPLQDWIHLWPDHPSDFREKIRNYAMEMRKIGIKFKIVEAIMESLGLSPNYLRDKIEQGMQILVINKYAQCYGLPSSSTFINTLGAAPHSDHSIITILLDNTPGLEILDHHSKAWKALPAVKCALTVLVGDHLEVLSNDIYESVLHGVGLSHRNSRISIGSFQSLAMGDMVEPALELVDQDNPKRYRANSFEEYLKHLSSKQPKPYIESLKI
ncbi:hypothetical protein FNV43_RR08976 [Rhamnella rubrinervis]|uniref:Fe2OG dioxygenase domain-containing protein n=1 Tax=Rhamnella rubrinervis TaxID=2594499 RepID=A0A8K0H9X7_9ROSA|nr:hypothetical protein FNV43_RR08976 [Rhamnella rubrinervis]